MKTVSKKHIKDDLIRILVFGILALLFLLFFSVNTSPLASGNYSGDSSFFILVGQGMTKGLMPYRDFFDMKGPYLFFFEYIGQKICYGRTGAFILQIIGLTITLFFADKANRLVLEKKNLLIEILMFIPWLFFAAGTYFGGHITVETCMPFITVCLYMVLKYFVQCNKSGNAVNHQKGYSMFYGITFGIILLIRPTNAVIIGAILLTMTVYLLVNKKIAELFKNAGFFVIGFAVSVIPMLIYYWSIGLLNEMLYQVFEFGFIYSEEMDIMSGVWALLYDYEWLVVFPTFASVAVLIIYKVRDLKYWLFGISNGILVFAAAFIGNVYIHYFALAIPNMMFAVWLLAEQIQKNKNKKAKNIISAILIAVMLFAPAKEVVHLNAKRFFPSMEQAQQGNVDKASKAMSEIIPDDEKDSVYCCFRGAGASEWYAKAQVFPYVKYCDWIEHYIELVPEIGTEIKNMFETSPPKWLVFIKDDYPDFAKEFKDTKYEKVCEAQEFVLYRNVMYELYRLK